MVVWHLYIYTGNHRCDRETAASSFEAEGGRSSLFFCFFGNRAALMICTFYITGEMNVENIDVFCEKGVFEVEHSQRILEVADIFCSVISQG